MGFSSRHVGPAGGAGRGPLGCTRSRRSRPRAGTPWPPRRPAVPHPGRADGPVLRAGHADHRRARRRRHASVDEVHGFRYFDDRDLIGFVDGTENPTGAERPRRPSSAPRTRSSPAAATSSCRSTCTTWTRWNALPVEQQEHDHRPGQAVQRRAGRRRQAQLRAQRADAPITDGRQRDQDRPGQHAVRPRRPGRVRHLLHRLRAVPGTDRADAAEHVRRRCRRATTTGCSTSARAVTGVLFFVPDRCWTFLRRRRGGDAARGRRGPDGSDGAAGDGGTGDGSLGIGSLAMPAD